jgi:cytochrome bd-type quinol oxidase subunit 1
MPNYLLERGLYAAMAAVLVVPELATFVVFLGFALGLFVIAGQFAWSLLHESDQGALSEPTVTGAESGVASILTPDPGL